MNELEAIAQAGRAGRQRVRGSSSGKGKKLQFSILSRLTMGHIRTPIQRVCIGSSTGTKRKERETYNSSQTSAEIKRK
jgi:hypothetical protein